MFRQIVFVPPPLDPDSMLMASRGNPPVRLTTLALTLMFRLPVPARACARMPLACRPLMLLLLMFVEISVLLPFAASWMPSPWLLLKLLPPVALTVRLALLFVVIETESPPNGAAVAFSVELLIASVPGVEALLTTKRLMAAEPTTLLLLT